MKFFMAQSWKENPAHHWKDQDSFEGRDAMDVGCIFCQIHFLVFIGSFISQSPSVLR